MTSCLVKPALYIVQKTGPRVKLVDQTVDDEEEVESDTGKNRVNYFNLIKIFGGFCFFEAIQLDRLSNQ